jgi:hypothetical protein
MARRRGVEHDVIEGLRGGRVAEELRELVERGDLDGARSRELLLHARDRDRRKHAAVGPDHALPVVVRRLLRVDVQRREAWNLRN